MENQNKVTNLKTGGSPYGISLVQSTFRNVSEVSFCVVSQRLLVLQPIPDGALEVLRKGDSESPSTPSSMKQFLGSETCRRAPL